MLYLHETMQFANRDIKPDNILFTTKENGTNCFLPDRAQIADFTTVVECKTPDFKVNDRAGTEAFSPPECFQGKSYLPKPCDVWALGVSIYCLI